MRAATPAVRVGAIVPSADTTFEDELGELLLGLHAKAGILVRLHGTRVRDGGGEDALDDAFDALCDGPLRVVVNALPRHTTLASRDEARVLHARLESRASARGGRTRVMSTSQALVRALRFLRASRIAMISPHGTEKAATLMTMLGQEGIEVVHGRSLGLADASQAARIDARKLLLLASQIDLAGSQALLLSACSLMPSLAIIEEAEQRFGLPVLSVATATAFELLRSLDIDPKIDGAGALLRSITPGGDTRW